MRNMRITTAHLARICGVSQGTVDRALNNRSDINAATKERILNAAKLYGYREPMEKESEDKISGQIGIIVFNLNNDYFSELVMEAERVLKESGFCTVVMMSHYDKAQELECIRKMYNAGVDGIMLCSVNGGESFKRFLELLDIPVIAVGNRIDGVPFVGIDDFAAMRDMTEYVIGKGFEKLVYFSPALKYDDAMAQKLRYDGFLDAVRNVKYETVCDTESLATEYDGKTAIICSTDYYAVKASTRTKGAKVFGFDNLGTIEEYNLGIDSLGYSVSGIAREAFGLIMNRGNRDVILKHWIAGHQKRG